MRTNWSELPFVRLLLPLITGILTAVYFPFTGNFYLSTFSIATAWSVLALLAWVKYTYYWRNSFGIWLHGCLFFLGIFLVLSDTDQTHPKHFSRFLSTENTVIGTVQHLNTNRSSPLAIIDVVAIAQQHTFWEAIGKLQLSIQAGDQLMPGDTIVLKARIHEVGPPLNPATFDYRRYLHFQNIDYQSFIKKDDWKLIAHCSKISFALLLQRWRRHCLEVLNATLQSPNERAVGQALILGYKEGLNQEVKLAYGQTGAMHVLAVSGLHVGIVCMALDRVLRPLRRRRWGRWIRLIALLSGVWMFALLAGGAASVLRAATMFSFIVIGTTIHRRANIYNTLAASAFVLLCINPFFIMDIGFQLSYLAVAGIVFFQPLIYRWWYIPRRWPDYFWKLTAVGLAAQITTFPISLVYFHQFPVYFWLSGWVVVPAAGIILSLGWGVMALHAFWLIGPITGWLLEAIILVMNKLVFVISDLPGGLIQNIQLEPIAVIALYGAILCFAIWLTARRGIWLLITLAWFTFTAAVNGFHRWKAETRREIVIYAIKQHSAIDLFSGRYRTTFSDLEPESPQIEKACHPYRTACRIRKEIEIPISKDTAFETTSLLYKNGICHFAGWRLAWMNALPFESPPPVPLSIDYLILYGNPSISIAALQRYFDFRYLVVDGSNARTTVKQWQKACDVLGISLIDISQNGAYRILKSKL